MRRHEKNPLITPSMLKPTLDEMEVMGAFNAGATAFGDEVILLLRVAERCKAEAGSVAVPIYTFEDGRGKPDILRFSVDDPDVKLKDTRGVVYKGIDYLTTLSTVRLARSKDGVNFTVDDKPFIYPCHEGEKYGCEDARVQKLGDNYYINYTAVSGDGWVTALAVTQDFKSLERMGTIFCPANKDVSIFPEKVSGKYWALHRPNNDGFGKASIWTATSENLMEWGDHKCIVRPRDTMWESMKIGGGCAPVKTDKGWLEIYHGKGDGQKYYLFGLLLDLDDPSKVIARAEKPFISPETDYETAGFFPYVVFSNGLVEKENGELHVYYGACDETTNMLITSKEELLADLGL